MATSGSYDFTVTRNQIITAALRKLGAIPRGATPSPEQITEGAEALNMIVKEWANSGVVLWTAELAVAAITAPSVIEGSDSNDYTCIRSHTSAADNKPITGAKWPLYWKKLGSGGGTWATSTSYTASGEIAPDVSTVDVLHAVIRDDDKDFMLKRLTWAEYMETHDKGAFGLPKGFAFDSKESPNIFLHPQPETDMVLSYKRLRMIQDFDAADDNPDVPARWYRALVYDLAANLSDEYSVPVPERQHFYQTAARYFAAAKVADMGIEFGAPEIPPEVKE